MKLSFGTLAGFLAGIGLFLFAVVSNTSNYLMFLSLSSFMLVLGGTVAATFVSFQEATVVQALKQMMQIMLAFKVSRKSLFADVERLIEWSNVAWRNGLMDLEDTLEEESRGDTFLALGARLLMSNYPTAQLRILLERIRDSEHERNELHASVLDQMASVSPAFGMVGTLVGMIIMLDSVEADMTAIGGGLAVALLTTLYGILFAQLVFKPSADKINQRNDQTTFRNTVILEGLIQLAEHTSPARIEDSLNSFLEPELYFCVADRKDKATISSVNKASAA